MNTNPVVFIGISAGHRHENSALAVIERVYVPRNKPYTWVKGRLPAPLRSEDKIDAELRQDLRVIHRLVHLDRLPAPSTVPGLVEETTRLASKLLKTTNNFVLIGEVTAISSPGWRSVMEGIQELIEDSPSKAVEQLPIRVSSIMGTAGQGPEGIWNVPRVDLLVSAQKVLDDRTFKIARRLKHATTLILDLESLDPTRNRSPLPDVEGRLMANDDLAYAVGAVLWASDRWVAKERHMPAEAA